MSTNCGIAVKTSEGYNTIYCHWDGYPSYMLPMLRENYNSEERAIELVSFGDASSIDKRLEPTPGSGHSFENPEDGVCVFYNRDRGERWSDVEPELLAQVTLFKCPSFEYIYIFEDGQWSAYKGKNRIQ